jgi:ribonuclease HII
VRPVKTDKAKSRPETGGSFLIVVGLDEAGRGPLAGPVVAAAVILPQVYDLPGLGDSKLVTEKRRDALEPLIKAQAIAWAVAGASVWEIEAINILQASLLAMRRAYKALAAHQAVKALVDGNQDPKLGILTELIVDGDQSQPCISAASILAKTARDRWMRDLDRRHPDYGLAGHKGYACAEHRQLILKHGPCPVHRRSFLGNLLGPV